MSDEKTEKPKKVDRSSAAFRRDLLRALPRVQPASSTLSSIIDVERDLDVVVELDGDAVLTPLQTVVKKS